MGKEIVVLKNLLKSLDDEFAWRRKELAVLKAKIPKERNSLQSAMLRSALPLLYAHWEGFVKLSMSYYLEHISRKYLKHEELNVKFITLSLQNKIGDLSENDFEKRTKIIELLFSEYQKKSNIPHKNIIQTKSNLRFEVLEEILFILDLSDAHLENKKTLINDLVNTRNHIAHGQQNLLDYDTFEIFHDDIIALMNYLKTKIENNAVQETYRCLIPNTSISASVTGP
jgi:hypothetical protein